MPDQRSSPADKRKIARRDFAYYMQVTDELSKKLIGYLTDISTGGFRLDTSKQIPAGQDFRMQIRLTSDVADKNSMTFVARSKWCHPDHVVPNTYNVGFEIVQIAPGDRVIFQRMFDKYGAEKRAKSKSSNDYLWR
jgi:c-di-GMP-binding flagellar brake protein YcgR